jgi:hypothetical protein
MVWFSFVLCWRKSGGTAKENWVRGREGDQGKVFVFMVAHVQLGCSERERGQLALCVPCIGVFSYY